MFSYQPIYALEVCSCSILRVSEAGSVLFDDSEAQALNGGIECDPVSLLPRKVEDAEEVEAPRLLWRPERSRLHALSSISSIQLIGRYDESEIFHSVKRALYPLNVCVFSFCFLS